VGLCGLQTADNAKSVLATWTGSRMKLSTIELQFSLNARTMKKIFLITISAIIFFGNLFILQTRRLEAMTISPPVLEIDAKRGDIVKEVIKAHNDSSETKLYYLSKGDFKAKGEEGQAEFIDNKNETAGDYSLSAWISLAESQIVLEAGERLTLPFIINVPVTAEPGGHYGVVFFSDAPPEFNDSGLSGVSIGSKMGVLILVKIEGDAEEGGYIEEYTTVNNRKFFSNLPVNYIVRFKNTGKVHLKPRGEIVIKNVFGKQVKGVTFVETFDENGIPIDSKKLDILPINYFNGNILPQSVRRFNAGWFKSAGENSGGFLSGLQDEWHNFAFGRFSSELTMVYGGKNQILTATGPIVYVFPWRITITCLAGLAFLFYALRFIIRRYNQWILARAGKNKIIK